MTDERSYGRRLCCPLDFQAAQLQPYRLHAVRPFRRGELSWPVFVVGLNGSTPHFL